jgi:hypothetical protein
MIAETYTGTDPEKDAALRAISELNAGIRDTRRDSQSGLESEIIIALQCVAKNRVAPSSWEAGATSKEPIDLVQRKSDAYLIRYPIMCLEHPQTRNLSNKYR